MTILLALLVVGALAAESVAAETAVPPAEAHVHPGFAKHNDAHDDASLVRLSEHVYAAIGFDIGNIGFVVTDEGVLVFDTGGEVERAELALAALREVTKAPIVKTNNRMKAARMVRSRSGRTTVKKVRTGVAPMVCAASVSS